MAKLIKLDSMQDLYDYYVEEPQEGQRFHATVITDHFSAERPFEGDGILKEENLTFVEYVAGGKGAGGIDVVGLIQEPLFWAYNLVIVVAVGAAGGVASGFTNAAGDDLYQFLKGSMKKFRAKRAAPGQICIDSHSGRLEIVVPAQVTEEQIEVLDRLISEKLQSMNGYSKVMFSPKRGELVTIIEH